MGAFEAGKGKIGAGQNGLPGAASTSTRLEQRLKAVSAAYWESIDKLS
jgi:hypothetical protein